LGQEREKTPGFRAVVRENAKKRKERVGLAFV
jgi:hypothetical protein